MVGPPNRLSHVVEGACPDYSAGGHFVNFLKFGGPNCNFWKLKDFIVNIQF